MGYLVGLFFDGIDNNSFVNLDESHKKEEWLPQLKNHGIVRGDSHGNGDTRTRTSFLMNACSEGRRLLTAAVPAILIQLLVFSLPWFLITCYIGRRYNIYYLDGFTLANLTGNLFTASFLQGCFTVTEPFSLQASCISSNTKHPHQVGVFAVRGFVASCMVVLPTIVLLCLFLENALKKLGENDQASVYAASWYRVYSLSLPFNALFLVTWQFLAAQNASLVPLLVVSTIGCAIVFPTALYCLQRVLDFEGTAWALLILQSWDAFVLMGYLKWRQPYDPATWPGLEQAWTEALDWKSMRAYLQLDLGGFLSSSSWIYWEAISMGIGSRCFGGGALALSIHTIPTQVLSLTYMIPQVLGLALADRLRSTLAARKVKQAKLMVVGMVVLSLVAFASLALVLYVTRHGIFRLFTTDKKLLRGAEAIWKPVCWYFFNNSMFAINMGIAKGLGMQLTLGVATIVILWIFALPLTYYFASVQKGGLAAVWTCLGPPYMAINIVMSIAFIRRDWDDVAADIRAHDKLDARSTEIPRHLNDDFLLLDDESLQLTEDSSLSSSSSSRFSSFSLLEDEYYYHHGTDGGQMVPSKGQQICCEPLNI